MWGVCGEHVHSAASQHQLQHPAPIATPSIDCNIIGRKTRKTRKTDGKHGKLMIHLSCELGKQGRKTSASSTTTNDLAADIVAHTAVRVVPQRSYCAEPTTFAVMKMNLRTYMGQTSGRCGVSRSLKDEC